MVLSGFTGIATYGMAKLVINKDGEYSEQLKALLDEYNKQTEKSNPVAYDSGSVMILSSAHILVQVKYSIENYPPPTSNVKNRAGDKGGKKQQVKATPDNRKVDGIVVVTI